MCEQKVVTPIKSEGGGCQSVPPSSDGPQSAGARGSSAGWCSWGTVFLGGVGVTVSVSPPSLTMALSPTPGAHKLLSARWEVRGDSTRTHRCFW